VHFVASDCVTKGKSILLLNTLGYKEGEEGY